MKFGVFLFAVSSVICISTGINWDLGEWIPIPGRCLTCDKGKSLYLYDEFGRASGTPLSSENKRRKKAFSSGASAYNEANNIVLEPKSALDDDDSNRIQLVYLPEGSINDLRTAKVAKVSKLPKILSRSVRSAQFPFSSGSRISFREISPRRPTALVAERGREREAQEQIQLLEAALNSPPEEVRDGELPRVFIAPTHLPPPPGYVKIPLLPSQNQVDNKRTLPGTFLTSEIHNQLPPGFVQVPLPENVFQLSHSIPFVNPNTNPLLQGSFHQQNRQQEQQHQQQQQQPQQQQQQHQPEDFRNPNADFGQFHTDNLRQPHRFNSPQQQQPQQQQQQRQPQDFRNPTVDLEQFHSGNSRQPQNFNSPQLVQQDLLTDQPLQHSVQTEEPVRQKFDVHQIAQNHFNIRRPIKQNFENDKNTKSFDRGQLDNINTQDPHQTFNQQQEQQQPFSQPEQHTVRNHQNIATISENFPQEPLFETPSEAPITDHEIQKDRQSTTDSNINTNQGRVRQQRVRPHNNQGQSVQDVPTTTDSPSTSKPHSNSFFEIGSSVIKPQNDFDYDPFNNLPDFNPEIDYEQFLLYDNQDFDIPSTNPDKSHGKITPTKQTSQEPSPITTPQTQTSFTEDKILSTIQAEEILITENPRVVPFQLSPKPIHILPELSPAPIETISKEPKETQTHSDFEHPDTQKSVRIQLSPKPVEETVDIVNVEETPSAQLNNRRRLRPTSFRGRTPSSSSRHRLNLSPKKVEDSQVTIGTAVVTKDVLDETTTPVVSPTSLPSLPTRNRFNNRRRRPFKQETTTKSEVVTESAITPKPAEASSTLFPPFSVAKRLNENPTATQVTSSRRDPSSLRGRFGSRIRARAQESDSPKIDETGTQNSLPTESLPPRRRGQRRRRLRARNGNGNGNGQPSGQRRRRVLNRVRKINPETSQDNLNNQIQKEELRGSESARVSFSQVPFNKVVDPTAETLTLINEEKVVNASEFIDQNTDNSEKKSDSDSESNIFNLLNLTPSTAEEVHLNEPSTLRPSLNDDLPIIAEDTEGYVNNSEPLSLLSHSFDEPSTVLVSLESQSSIPEHDIGTLDTTISNGNNESPSSSSFDALLSTLAQSSHVSTEPELSGTVLDDTHVEYDKSLLDLQHASQHNFENDDENITLINDNTPNLLPENETSLQDNYYDYESDNGTFFGSSAHVVYAVAISETPPEENDLTTQIPNEEDSTADQTTEKEFQPSSISTAVESITDSPPVDVSETTLADLITNSSPNKLSSEPIKEISETVWTLDEDLETTEPSSSHSESITNFDDTSSFVDDIAVENITLFTDSNSGVEIEDSATDQTILEPLVPETEATEENILHMAEETERKSTSNVDPNNFEVATENTISNNETNNDQPLESKTNDLVSSGTENSTKNVAEHSSNSNKNLTSSFLSSFFPTDREGKENNLEVEGRGPIIIGRSTVTEVRSSAPVICIDGNCVIGAGIRKR